MAWAALASGAYQGWPLTGLALLAGAAAALWLAGALRAGRLEWRRTPLDLPLLLLLALVAIQLVIGNRALVYWALAPGAPVTDIVAQFPAPFLGVGTVAPRHTLAAALLFVVYALVYLLLMQTLRTRRQLGGLVRGLLMLGGLMAFVGLLDYLTGEIWLARWREHPFASRLSGTFVNPDHFAAWLAMLIALGLGWMVSRSGEGRGRPGLGALLSVRELREQAVRRYLPLVGIVVMAVALVFTLSRGGLVNLVVALLALLTMLWAVGRARRSLILTGVLLVAVLAYGGWIGFGPVLARLSAAPQGTAYRFGQYVASLPLLREFPLLGVGLGAYRDVYFRHQPLAHQPEILYFPYAHNDLLQLVLELGPLGAALGLFLGWRIAGDLVLAHLLGRGACPVDGGAGPQAVRSDLYSVGIAVGALAGLAGLIAHSALDFSVRMPAVGVTAATLLALATVALHTRLVPGREDLLSGVVTVPLRPPARVAFAAVALVLVAGWSWAWIWSARVRAAEQALAAAPASAVGARADALLALDRRNPDGLLMRARTRQGAALAAWESPPAPGVDRDRLAREGLARAREDLRTALTVTPTNPWLHLDLAWVEASDVVVQGRAGRDALATALSHGARAVALGSDSPLFYAGMARLAYSIPELSVRAAREGVRRRPSLLIEMIELYRPLGLSEDEWLALVPDTALDRLELAVHLEARRLGIAALAAYRAALAVAAPAERTVCAWALAEGLGRAGRDAEAVPLLTTALASDAGNPELQRALGAALARAGDPAALDHLRAAVEAADRAAVVGWSPFAARGERLPGLIALLAGDLDRPARYRRALASYLTERRMWAPALVQWRALVSAAPRDAEARFGRGVAQEGAGAIDEAIADFRAAVELAPRTGRYRRRLAERLWRSEQFFQAINEWRTLKEQEPHDVDARLALARAYEKVGQPTDAYREYREALAIAPGLGEAMRAIDRLEGSRR
ncbi:MAG TPA: O-antigen ligase family protein [Methylomirabilota bacterium]|nr:O-antigen ligase family protein [Methylomirabilota bacterium]